MSLAALRGHHNHAFPENTALGVHQKLMKCWLSECSRRPTQTKEIV